MDLSCRFITLDEWNAERQQQQEEEKEKPAEEELCESHATTTQRQDGTDISAATKRILVPGILYAVVGGSAIPGSHKNAVATARDDWASNHAPERHRAVSGSCNVSLTPRSRMTNSNSGKLHNNNNNNINDNTQIISCSVWETTALPSGSSSDEQEQEDEAESARIAAASMAWVKSLKRHRPKDEGSSKFDAAETAGERKEQVLHGKTSDTNPEPSREKKRLRRSARLAGTTLPDKAPPTCSYCGINATNQCLGCERTYCHHHHHDLWACTKFQPSCETCGSNARFPVDNLSGRVRWISKKKGTGCFSPDQVRYICAECEEKTMGASNLEATTAATVDEDSDDSVDL